jgi:hypothetical protein
LGGKIGKRILLAKKYSMNCQLILFAVNRLGYLVLPKAFQKNRTGKPAHFIRCQPHRLSRLTQSLSKESHREASSFYSLSTASAISSYPKPFKRMLRILLAFLLLVILHKQACDAALNQKSLSLS